MFTGYEYIIKPTPISRSNQTMAILESIYVTLRQLHFRSIKVKIKKANHIKKLIDQLATNTINSIEQKKSRVEDKLSRRKIQRIISFVKESTQTEQRYINRSLIGQRLFYRRH